MGVQGRSEAETLSPVDFHPFSISLHLAFGIFKTRISPLSLALSSGLETTLDSVVFECG